MLKLRVLVTGANGFVGAALVRQLLELGHHVVASVRQRSLKLPVACEQQIGMEIAAETDWSVSLRNIDVVIHLAARVHVMKEGMSRPLLAFREINTAGTIRLASQSVDAGVRRFIFISSIGVNGSTTGELAFSETSVPAPHSDYAISKLEAEIALRAICGRSAMEYVILRPPMVYGPHAPGNFSSLLKFVDRGVPLPFGAVQNRRSMINVENLSQIICLCLSAEGARNELFLVADSSPVSTPELLRLLATGMGKRNRLLPVPPYLLQLVANLLRRGKTFDQLCGSLHINTAKATTILGWKPVTSIHDGLVAVARDYKHGRAHRR